MIIDFHTHIFPEKIAAKSISYLSEKSGVKNNTDGTAQGLAESMAQSGVDMSVVLPVATKPQQFDSILRYACEVNEKYEGRLLSFGGIHPLDEDYKQHLRQIKAEGLRGIKLHPDYQDSYIDDIGCKRIIYEAAALGLITVVHAGRDIGWGDPVHCPPERVIGVIDEINPEKLVLAHLGGWEQWDAVAELICGRNIWLDTAFCLEYIKMESFYEILEKHGCRRMLFATDSPWSPQKGYIDRLTQLLPDSNIRNAVLGENAWRLLYGDRKGGQEC